MDRNVKVMSISADSSLIKPIVEKLNSSLFEYIFYKEWSKENLLCGLL